MSDEEFKTLKVQCNMLKNRLFRFEQFLNDAANHKKIDEIDIRLQRLDETWNEFQTVQLSIELIDNSDEICAERNDFEDKYFYLVSRFRYLINTNKTHSNNNQVVPNNYLNPSMNIKLPQIDLPHFNGTYENWLPFYEGFKALVLDNPSLNNIQRFYYLLSALKNDSIQVVQSLEISDHNFDIAWQLLKDRYENKRVIVQNHIKGIFELPVMSKENHGILRKIIDGFSKHQRALKSLGQPVNTWDTLLIYILSNKLDNHTRREWEASLKSDQLPDITIFLDFLKNKAQLLETLDTRETNRVVGVKSDKSFMRSSSHLVTKANDQFRTDCRFCRDNHMIYKCDKLLALSPKARYTELNKLNICCNCLKFGHSVNTCRSSSACKQCHKRHNTVLHFNNYIVKEKNVTESPTSNCTELSTVQPTHSSVHISQERQILSNAEDSIVSVTSLEQNLLHSKSVNEQVLLSTVQIHVFDINNKPLKCRALLDSGSQSNFMTHELFKVLKLDALPIQIPVTGINQTKLNINKKVFAKVKSTDSSYSSNLSFLILNKITSELPQYYFSPSELNIPDNIEISDPEYNKPGKIDMLLGSGVFFSLLSSGKIELNKYGLILQQTKLGWILAGPLQIPESNSSEIVSCSNVASNCLFTQNDNLLNEQLERFWQIEDLSSDNTKLSNEELDCEIHFRKHFEQDTTGRFTVQLPLKSNHTELGESVSTAIQRLKHLESKLARNDDLRKQYHEFLQEYEDLGHMSRVNIELDKSNEIHNYLPHHAVVKEDSSTTRVRVVFDASSKTASGLSLNDVMMIGPVVQRNLFDILVHLRIFNVVITADVAKMYRQIFVHESQRNLQRIVWRKEPSQEVKHYQLNTITYGTASASFLATRTLHQIGLNCKDTEPKVSDAILNNFYMDDLICGASTIEEAIALKSGLERVLSNSGLTLRKWRSNKQEVLNTSLNKESENESQSQYVISSDMKGKTLGIYWDTKTDIFQYLITYKDLKKPITKKVILSTIATIFDPLGLICPCIIRGKLFLQRLWQLKIDWNEEIPGDFQDIWRDFIDTLTDINKIQIPRHVILTKPSRLYLHGFSDGSEVAYGACIYIVSTDDSGHSLSNLICSKSRVSPIKTISLPRLELCAALLLAQLMNTVRQALKLDVTCYFWTDSKIVLAWLNDQPNRWKTFVANRVSEIQCLSEHSDWYHVPSPDNPADIVSRGLQPSKLIHSKLWWHGPEWLTQSIDHWPSKGEIKIDTIPEMRKEKIILTYHTITDSSIFSRYSSFSKLQRVVAYILRFNHNSRNKDKLDKGLSHNELERATLVLCKMVQALEFPVELALLCQSKSIHKNSNILSLDPFIDKDGLIRVGGRLKHSSLTFEQKHPILLPGKHILTKLLIKHEHHKCLHAGSQLILARLRTKFWPINGRNAVRSVLKNCLTCFKTNPKTAVQKMGDLPESRITPSRAFYHCGIDYTGFYNLKDGKSRTRTLVKCYLCIFVCLATKAVHVELVSDLTTETFMNAFKRFVSRRGLCRHIYTDNGTNFVGAHNNMQDVYKILKNLNDNEKYYNYFKDHIIEWHFIPARSPHFGGMWEAAVKSFKHHLKRVVTDASLTFEEFYTVLTQIEAILNSRPLSPLSNDPLDLYPLTPGHFLIGDALVSVPQQAVVDLPLNRLSHYKKLQQMVQSFWNRWSNEYLHTLQQRSKWKEDNCNVAIGSLVLLKDENLPPMSWQLGRIMEVIPGKDDKVRVVLVRVRGGIVRRAIHKICPLPQVD